MMTSPTVYETVSPRNPLLSQTIAIDQHTLKSHQPYLLAIGTPSLCSPPKRFHDPASVFDVRQLASQTTSILNKHPHKSLSRESGGRRGVGHRHDTLVSSLNGELLLDCLQDTKDADISTIPHAVNGSKKFELKAIRLEFDLARHVGFTAANVAIMSYRHRSILHPHTPETIDKMTGKRRRVHS